MSVAVMDPRPQHIVALNLQRAWMQVAHFLGVEPQGRDEEPLLAFSRPMREQLLVNSQQIVLETADEIRRVTREFSDAMQKPDDPDYDFHHLQVDENCKALQALRQWDGAFDVAPVHTLDV